MMPGPSPTSAMAPDPTSSSSPASDQSSTPKTVLDYVFIIAALVLVCALVGWRYAYIRHHAIPFRSFFHAVPLRSKNTPLPTTSPTATRFMPPEMPSLPVEAHPRTRTCRPDLDAGGRRAVIDVKDINGEKDELPTYEDVRVGRPPRYMEVDVVDVRERERIASLTGGNSGRRDGVRNDHGRLADV
ncbi:hypothetical protein EW146_g3184 [Bondarzewia mesenterica]|uniref:Uncharacterized protein n=1 Tax=Bondarzewia mesenterica TaxID=1095465 RepID=A0A4S4M497_9AGAM|nr:hypothetical protein EW146_g3184 [Bondarzewia mesenterica]